MKKKPETTASNQLIFTDEEFLAMEKQLDEENQEVLDYINSDAEE